MSWNKSPTDLMLEIDETVATVRNEKAAFGLRLLINDTPVDTGLAVGKWRVHTYNTKKGRTILGRAKYFAGAVTGAITETVRAFIRGDEMRTGAEALSEGLKEIEKSKRYPYAELAFINDSEYLHYVNNGTRYIRPRRFVENTLNSMRVYFR